MDNKQYKIFISYSHKNREVCESIESILADEGSFSVWYDKGLVPGEVYRKKIVETIKECDYFIILISADSISSEWVLDELEFAKKQHKKILPIWVEDARLPDDLDMILQRYHSLFWHLRSSETQFRDSLLAAFDIHPAADRGQALVGFGNEFSELDNIKMKELLSKEQQAQFSECYRPENACLLGCAYLFGGPCAVDREKAGFYFEIAEYFGNTDGTAYLLQMALEDEEREIWDEPDKEFCAPIIREISRLAEDGSVPAMLFMGNAYWYGKYGCERDMEKSAVMYETCAKLGNARAQYIMASNYYLGEGVKQNYSLALMYTNLALEQKYLKSWRRWGKFYRDGRAVKQDYAKARECYEKGALMGDYNCYNKIGDMLYYGWGFPVDYEAAFRCYLKGEGAPAYGEKYAVWKAKQALGRCYENGHGVEKNIRIASEKYLEGYRFGSIECRDAYLRCCALLNSEKGDKL